MVPEDITRQVHSFQHLEWAAKVSHVMDLTAAERDQVMMYLLLETHSEIQDIRNERRWIYGLGHLGAVIIASIVGIFGQPLRP